MESGPDIEALIARGELAEAAAALAASDDPTALRRAQEIYERLWDFARAAGLARRRGERPDEVRLLLAARDTPGAFGLAREIAAAPRSDDERTRTAAVLEKQRHFAEAARLYEAAGGLDRAVELYRKGGALFDAARLLTRLGRLREAGLACERLLADEPDSPDAARAEAALGHLLGDLGRHEEALRRLQRARARAGDVALSPTESLAAGTRIVIELAALGYQHGARQLLGELRAHSPELGTLEELLRTRAETARGEAALLAGRYEVVRPLGAGGMGRVYLARDRIGGREVAVKVVASPVDTRGAGGYARFVREARIVAALRHPNLVKVIEFHESLGLLVMEYMAGGTLEARLAGGNPLPERRVRAILLQLARGLAAAHAHGVIHRDVKPANIFFSATAEAKLGDFGVAHLMDLGATQTAGFIGTLAYMAPEQITGARLSFACDLYALGVTAFQMLSGRLPFAGPDFVGQHLGATPPSPSSLRPELARWDELVLRLLEKDPGARPGSLDELTRALEALPLPAVDDQVTTSAALEEPGAVAPRATESRYRIEAELGRHERSLLLRGLDQRLGRRVLIEEFTAEYSASAAGAAHLAWLGVMARHGGPHLQRVLRCERGALVRVVYEAPAGPRVADLPPSRDPGAGLRLLAEGCRALAGPHDEGVAHGAVASSLIVEPSGATLLLAAQLPSGATPADDVAALLGLVAAKWGAALVADAPRASVADLVRWLRDRRP